MIALVSLAVVTVTVNLVTLGISSSVCLGPRPGETVPVQDAPGSVLAPSSLSRVHQTCGAASIPQCISSRPAGAAAMTESPN